MNINTTIDINDTDYNRVTINNHVAKNMFDQNQQDILRQLKQVIANQHPENQIVFNKLFVVSGKWFYTQPIETNSTRDISIFSDSTSKGIKWSKLESGKLEIFLKLNWS